MTDHVFDEHAVTGRVWAGTVRAVFLLVALSVVGVVLAIRLAHKTPDPAGQDAWLVAWLVVGLVDAIAGAVLVTRLGYRRLAACLMIIGVAAVLVVVLATRPETAHGSTDLGLADPGSWARPLGAGVLVALVPWELAMTSRPRTYEVVWWITVALVAGTTVGEAVGAQSPGLDVVDVAIWLVAVSATAAMVHIVIRWHRSRAMSDDPLLGWLAAGSFVAWLAVVPERLDLTSWEFPGSGVVGPALLLATLPLLVVGVLVRAMRERPGRFHGVAHDVIGWLVLSGAIILVYTVVVVGVGHVLGGRRASWLLVAATVVVALAVEPIRKQVHHTVDRMVWGARDDPLEVVREVVEHVGTDSGDELLPRLVTSLRGELRLDSVAIDVSTVDGWRREASLGSPTTYSRAVPLEQHGELVGRLVVGWEYGPHLRDRDERLLAEIAVPLALAVGWVRLANDLRRASVAVVTAREEERRRLRRDLHDGLGPSLTGVSLGVHTAIRQLERTADPSTVEALELLGRTADEVDALVLEVKRIARDLRPTALDQLGLVRAIEAFTRVFDDRLQFHVSCPTEVGLPAAVEVAVYRIVTEAVTNVVRHAGASQCWLTIGVGREVEIDVVDDGVGVGAADAVPVGVGWTAMRERAIELGGHLQVTTREPHGTHVRVRIPVSVP